MRTKVTLVLVFLNVALFFFIFYVRPRWATQDQLREARNTVLSSAAADIQAIEITAGTQTTRLVKRGELWHLSQPIDWPANPHAISRILSELQFLKQETAFDVASLAQNKLSLADYGLDKPSLSVTITPSVPKGNTEGQPVERITLRIGNVTNVGNRLYVLSPDGQRIHVVARSFAESLTLPLEQLRSPALFTIPEFEVRSLSLQIAAPANLRVSVRREASRWSLEAPVVARANSAAVKQAITLLSTLKVGSFLTQPPPPELNPSTSPVFRITLGGNNRSETLLIGGAVPQATEPSYYSQIDGKASVFTLPLSTDLIDTLRAAQDKLREPKILEFDPRNVTSIMMRAPNQTEITLQRLESPAADSAAQWQFVRRGGNAAPTTQAADAVAVQHLIDSLSRLSALKFLRDAPTSADEEAWGFNSPEREIVVQTSVESATTPRTTGSTAAPAGTQTLQIGLGADRGPRAYARLDSARYVYEVDGEILKETPTDARAWRDRRLRELPAGARITMLRITDLNTQKVIQERSLGADASASQTLEPADATPEQKSAWQTLVAQLRSLHANAFVTDRYSDSVMALGEERRWRYQIDLGIILSGGTAAQASTQTLMLTDRIGGKLQLAGAKDLDSIFEIDQAFIDAFWTLTYVPPTAEITAEPAKAAKP